MQIATRDDKIEFLKKEVAKKYSIKAISPKFKQYIGIAMRTALMYGENKQGLIDYFDTALFNQVLDDVTGTPEFNKNDLKVIQEVKSNFYDISA